LKHCFYIDLSSGLIVALALVFLLALGGVAFFVIRYWFAKKRYANTDPQNQPKWMKMGLSDLGKMAAGKAAPASGVAPKQVAMESSLAVEFADFV